MLTTFLRDQLVAVLRESFPTPLRIFDILPFVPEGLSGSVYRSLRALEKSGAVSRCSFAGDRGVFWTYLPIPELASEIDHLEKLVV